MEQLYKRITIDGDVNRLPKEDGEYFVCRSGFKSVFDFVKGKSEMMWMKEVRWYLQPISTPEVIVGPTEIEIDKRADHYSNNWDEDSTQKSISYTSYRRGVKYALSQLKTVNLKDEIVKVKQKALNIQKDWQYPNEIYIECTGAIMACDELLESLSKDSQSKNVDK